MMKITMLPAKLSCNEQEAKKALNKLNFLYRAKKTGDRYESEKLLWRKMGLEFFKQN